MKKLLIVVGLTTSLLLGGCSLIEEVDQSLNYVQEATEYVNELTSFSEELPQLTENAVTNPEVRKELGDQLTALTKDIEAFNNLEAPAFAQDIHQQLTEQNKILQDKINHIMVNGEVAVEQLQNTELLRTVEEITHLRNQLEQLGGN